MDVAFLDTNALMKMYLAETGSAWLQNFLKAKQIVISELALIEATTVLRRQFIEGRFDKTTALAKLNQIEADSINFEVIPFDGKFFRDKLADAIYNLASGFRIRSLDAIHLAAAIIAREDAQGFTPIPGFTFVSSDVQLLRVGVAQGFVVENPENYP